MAELQRAYNGDWGVNTDTITLPGATTVGSRLILSVYDRHATPPAPTSNLGHDFTLIDTTGPDGSNASYLHIFESDVTASSGTCTVDLNLPADFIFYNVFVIEHDGGPIEDTALNTGTFPGSTTPTSSTTAASAAGGHAFGFLHAIQDANVDITSPASDFQTDADGLEFSAAYVEQTISASATFSFSGTASNNSGWHAAAVIVEPGVVPPVELEGEANASNGATGSLSVTRGVAGSSNAAAGIEATLGNTSFAGLVTAANHATGLFTTTRPLAGSANAANGARAILSGQWAFEDDFSGGLGNWSISRGRAAPPDGSDPQHVAPVDFTGGTSGATLPPDDVVVNSGVLWIGCGSQNYGDTLLRCMQPFDFSSGSGVIECGVILPDGSPLHGWTQILVTDKPYTTPSMISDNSGGPIAQYGFGVRLNWGIQSVSGDFRPFSRVVVWDDHTEAVIEPTGGIVFSETTPVDVRIEFDHSNVTAYVGGVEWWTTAWTLPAELTSGYVYMGTHNHASLKYAPEQSSHHSRWTYMRFDGDVLDVPVRYRVPDNTTTHFDAGYGGTGVDIGWLTPTSALSIPSIPGNVDEARLLLSGYVSVSNYPSSGIDVQYRINGGTWHDLTIEYWPPLTGVFIVSELIDETELNPGVNTIAFQTLGAGSGYPPFVSNIELLVVPGTGGPVDYEGSTAAANSAVGTMSVARGAAGSAVSSSAATSNYRVARSYAGNLNSANGATGAYRVARAFASTLNAANAATGVLTDTGFAGVGTAANHAVATLGITRAYSGSSSAAAHLVAALSSVSLQGESDSAAHALGTLVIARRLVGQANASNAISSSLTIDEAEGPNAWVGTGQVAKVYLGASEVSKIYLGSTEL